MWRRSCFGICRLLPLLVPCWPFRFGICWIDFCVTFQIFIGVILLCSSLSNCLSPSLPEHLWFNPIRLNLNRLNSIPFHSIPSHPYLLLAISASPLEFVPHICFVEIYSLVLRSICCNSHVPPCWLSSCENVPYRWNTLMKDHRQRDKMASLNTHTFSHSELHKQNASWVNTWHDRWSMSLLS